MLWIRSVRRLQSSAHNRPSAVACVRGIGGVVAAQGIVMVSLGRALITLGIVLVLIGLLFIYFDFFSFMKLGRLPGDISIKRENFSFYFPLTTCLLLSVLFTLILYLLRR